MADFLTRLAERALGQATLAQPIIVPNAPTFAVAGDAYPRPAVPEYESGPVVTDAAAEEQIATSLVPQRPVSQATPETRRPGAPDHFTINQTFDYPTVDPAGDSRRTALESGLSIEALEALPAEPPRFPLVERQSPAATPAPEFPPEITLEDRREQPRRNRESELPFSDSPSPLPAATSAAPRLVPRQPASPATSQFPPAEPPITPAAGRRTLDMARQLSGPVADHQPGLPPAIGTVAPAPVATAPIASGATRSDFRRLVPETTPQERRELVTLEPPFQSENSENAAPQQGVVPPDYRDDLNRTDQRASRRPAPPSVSPVGVSPAPEGPPPQRNIRVTIGRVEIRASLPHPAPAAPAPRRYRPALGLNDYLKQRNGQQR